MYYSQLLELNDDFTEEQIYLIDNLLASMTSNTVLTLSRFMEMTGLDINSCKSALKRLCDINLLLMRYAVRCPECELILREETDLDNIGNSIYCHKCEADMNITSDDIEVIYLIVTPPFDLGQQYSVRQVAVAQAADILSNHLPAGDFNKIFYNPSEEQYTEMKRIYASIFESQDNTTEQGNTLENLSRFIFNCCVQYTARKLRTEQNDIDCFVRSKFSVVGSILAELGSEICVECKNEKSPPTITYFKKIQSIMDDNNVKFGIILSKEAAPSTYANSANLLYIKKGTIIISIDKNDLREIVIERKNLLECIERKACEIKMTAKNDLVEIGLFDC